MDMRKIVSFIIVEVHANDNAVEHADGRHKNLKKSRNAIVAQISSKITVVCPLLLLLLKELLKERGICQKKTGAEAPVFHIQLT